MKLKRSLTHIFFIFFTIIFPKISTILNEKEIAVISNLVNEMEIRFCIILSDSNEIEIHDSKRLSNMNIPSTQLNIDQFLLYITSIPSSQNDIPVIRYGDFSTSVIFKGKTLDLMKKILQIISANSMKVEGFEVKSNETNLVRLCN